ncbi:MAG: tetratricopeptide repeat protein [Nitrospira sp.]|nr:tetratricopeptide repeat protein [Nitrospira sp.]
MAQPHDRQIRVFISSTFRDMVEEREQLMSHTWPALRQFCRERQVEFVEVDLRWGIPEAQNTRDETLKICLQEIQACRPYFIALVGERYGWIPGPEALTPDLLEEEPWLQEHQGKSVAELEILQGLLRNPDPGRAFLYLRDPAYAQAKGPDYLPEDATHAARQRALKTLIRETCARQKIPLREDYPDPRRVAELVLQDLQAVIEADYPKDPIPDPLTKEARDHEAFAESRRRTYIGRTDYVETLDRHAMDDGGPFVLLGESGSGKSALLANWVALWRDAHPRDLIIQHYIGSTPDSADHWRLMRRLIAEIKRWTEDPEAIPSSHDGFLKTFPLWLAKAKSKAERTNVRCLLILDALNQLEDREHARLLGWLPAHSFAGPLRLITSTLPGEPLQTAQSRGWTSLKVAPLTTEERGRMIAAYLKRVGKTLDDRRIAWLASAPQTANPLYLKILLDDLRVTGTHARLDERVREYLAAPDIPSLLTLVLARYRRDYERDRPGLVGEALGLIWAARRGLTETELLELLAPDQPQLPQAIWAPVRAALEDLLVDRGVILNFAHDYLRTAVALAFAPNEDTANEHRLRLADFFQAQPISARSCDELPWLLWTTDARIRLRSCLLAIDRFLLIHQRDSDELMRYWVGLGHERVMGQAYRESFESWANEPGREDGPMAVAANSLGYFLAAAALYAEAAPLSQRALAIREQALGPEHPDVAASCNNLATLYDAQGAYAKAEPLYKRALAIWEQALGPEHPLVATSCNNLAMLYDAQGAYAKAEPLSERAVEILRLFHRMTGHPHPDFETIQNNYNLLLQRKTGDQLPGGFLARVRKLFQQ